MTLRSEVSNRKREVRASMMNWLASRLLTRKTSGVDGLLKKLVNRRAPSPSPDDDLEQMALEVNGPLEQSSTNALLSREANR